MSRVVLLNPPLSKEERGGALSSAIARSIPYGLLSLAAVIRDAGYAVSLVDATNLGYDVEETVNKVLAFNPDVVGITTVTMSVDRCGEIAALLKARKSGLDVMVGGAHVSSTPQETMERFPAFDVGVVGEGEATVLEVLKALASHAPLDGIDGVVCRRGTEIVRTPRRKLIENLDTLPLPAWDLLSDMHLYHPSAPSYIRLPSTTIVTSRGCPGRCIFCNSRAMYGNLRCFSAGYVVRMIQHLIAQYGIRDISIYDDNFLFIRPRVEEICQAMIDQRMNLTWSCYSRVDQGDRELFRLMKRAGCWQVSYGIESGSQRVLDFIRKDVTLQQIEQTVRLTKQAGLRTRGFFIIGHLTEDRQSILDTMEFMLRIPLDDFHFTTFTPLPGTVAYKIADQYGTMDRTWSKMNMQIPVFIPTGLTSEELEQYSQAAYRKFYFRPRIVASYLGMLLRHPRNMVRLLNGAQALLTRIFVKQGS